MSDDNSIDWSLLERHLAGEASPADDLALTRWLDADPSHRELLEGLRALWQRSRTRPARYDSAAGWAELERAIDEGETPAEVIALEPRRRTARFGLHTPSQYRMSWVARIAAVLLLAAGAAGVWQLAVRRSAPAFRPAQLREVTTARGQRATVRLADGTRVELGVDSRLRYAPEYGADSRDVYLEGQAYFDVVHDARRPFAVHTARALVRDIGTKFGVRSYADAPAVEVVVAEGAVALVGGRRVGATLDSLVLKRADLGRVDAAGRLASVHGVDVAARLAWTEGRLVFTDTPLGDVLPELSRWYNASIRLGDSSLADLRYTASVKDESLPQLLNLLGAALELRVERDGAVWVLYPLHRAHSH